MWRNLLQNNLRWTSPQGDSERRNYLRRTIVSHVTPVPTSLLQPIPSPTPDGYNQRWTVFVDGDQIDPAHITFYNESQGLQLDWGTHPDNRWSQFVYREVHGGGVVSVPYAVDPADGKVYIGTVDIRRPFRDPVAGHTVTELPRGMRDRNETAAQAAMRETQEETGHSAQVAEYFELEGEGANPNSTFFLTYNQEEQQADGIRFMSTKLPFGALKASDGGNYVLAQEAELDVFEGIKKCVFVPFSLRLARLGDLFTSGGLFRLLDYLEETNSVTFTDGVVTIN